VAALEDRCHVLVFEQSALEVHRQAASWYWDQEIFDFIACRLHLIAQHSLRMYLQAWELKQAGLDWRQAVLCRFLAGPALAVARLKADPAFASEAARVEAFIQSGTGCRATYFHHARKLKSPAQAPTIELMHTTPPPAPTTDYLDRLRRWFGQLGNG
jgi:hypothetical protein